MLFNSGDGTLTAFNIRRKRMKLQSELFDSELLSLSIIKVFLGFSTVDFYLVSHAFVLMRDVVIFV